MRLRYPLQSGVALVLLMLTLLLASGSYLLVQHVNHETVDYASSERRLRTMKLQKAKQALLTYAVSYADNYLPTGAGPGHLPCPDRSPIADDNEGNDGPDPPCSRDGSNRGRFPRFTYSRDHSDPNQARKRIEFYPERSFQDQQMWYAVSRSHINNPVNTVVNPATKGQLQVDSKQDIVAVIIEPGKDLSVTNPLRPGDTESAYLEGENADNDSTFSQLSHQTGNDLLVYITADELMQHTRSRVAVFAKRWLREYRQRHCGLPNQDCYPAAASDQGICQLDLNEGYLPLQKGDCPHALTHNSQLDGVDFQRHWFIRNQWLKYLRYTRHPLCIVDVFAACRVSVGFQPEKSGTVLISVEPTAAVTSTRMSGRISRV